MSEHAIPFSDAVAGYYDDIYPDFESATVISFLESAGHPQGKILELGIGTGRIGLPLAEHGYDVHGVEASPKMLEILRAKPGAERITLIPADFTTLDLGAEFDVVLAPFNVFCCALTPEEQAATMQAIARHLAPGGVAVLETFDPAPYHVQTAAVTNVNPVGDSGVLIENIRTFPAEQLMVVVNTLLRAGSDPEVSTLLQRYVWPSELDLLADAAGLELVDRYGGWARLPFTGTGGQQMCVSVYQSSR
ncbi:methyltransferase domain-containing protein [Actinoplanes sp. NEAU-A12]|uniref:Methyltransferase domain-containing protein n=1 Tax=Actinoplanes sandaracinus TaxID=3045177 RepID=A0ABT6WHG1_9ACTN|nr:class I SAM-dependent methyltransferase [Actinoplanes sandaracinus]MDI6099138.1 methyltransferase domain-containing protein [Actinoplanes sandaracinus]